MYVTHSTSDKVYTLKVCLAKSEVAHCCLKIQCLNSLMIAILAYDMEESLYINHIYLNVSTGMKSIVEEVQ